MSNRGKNTGMAAALHAVPEWKTVAKAWFEKLDPGVEVQADDLVAAIGLPQTQPGVNANNAVGAAFNAAQRRGLIKPSGKRVPTQRKSNHGRYVTLWVAT